MTNGEILRGWFYILAFVGMAIGFTGFLRLLIMMSLYNDLIAKLRQEHPAIFDSMKVSLPHPMHPTNIAGLVDTDRFVDFLENDERELSSKTMQAKKKYQRAYADYKKILAVWIILGITFFLSAIIAFVLIIVLKAIKD